MFALSSMSIMRLARLTRITRAVRVLKLRFFKELNMMISGIFGGMKTLFWSFVLLLVIVYIVGVALRQVMTPPQDCESAGTQCSHAEMHLSQHYAELFSSTPRCMFTVFRCLTDGCGSVDGTPLSVYFYDSHGIVFILAYVTVVIFIMFGVFNLIMAIFVEKTLETAKVATAKRQEARYLEDLQAAQELQQVVLTICSQANEVQHAKTSAQGVQGTGDRRMKKLRFALKGQTYRNGNNTIDEAALNVSVNREAFDAIINDKDIQSILEKLEVSVTNSGRLFDILDANNNGALDVSELAEGLLKLKGPPDRGDAISTVLMMQSQQKAMQDLLQDLARLRQTFLQGQRQSFTLLRQICEHQEKMDQSPDSAWAQTLHASLPQIFATQPGPRPDKGGVVPDTALFAAA